MPTLEYPISEESWPPEEEDFEKIKEQVLRSLNQTPQQEQARIVVLSYFNPKPVRGLLVVNPVWPMETESLVRSYTIKGGKRLEILIGRRHPDASLQAFLDDFHRCIGC